MEGTLLGTAREIPGMNYHIDGHDLKRDTVEPAPALDTPESSRSVGTVAEKEIMSAT